MRRTLTRGGYSSSSVPEAISRTIVSHEPAIDIIDQRLERDHKMLATGVADLRDFRHRLNRTLNFWLLTAEALPDQPTLQIACQSPACPNIVTGAGEDRLRTSSLDQASKVCPRCYKHERRHGLPWPQHRSTAR